jgi:hypothetical protein
MTRPPPSYLPVSVLRRLWDTVRGRAETCSHMIAAAWDILKFTLNYELFATGKVACTLPWCKTTCWLQEACWRNDPAATFISAGVSAMKTMRYSTWQGRNMQPHDCSSLRYNEIHTASGFSVSELRRYWTICHFLFCDSSLQHYSSERQLHCPVKNIASLKPPAGQSALVKGVY